MNRSPLIEKPHLGPGGGGSFPQCGTCRLCIRLLLWHPSPMERMVFASSPIPTQPKGIGDDPKQAIHPDKVKKID